MIITLIIALIAVTYTVAGQGELTLDQLDAKISELQTSTQNQYLHLENRIAVLTNQVNNLDDQDIERASPASNLMMNGILLGLIAFLFIMNVTTMIRLKSLKPTKTTKTHPKDIYMQKLKKYIDYCRFQKGMKMIDCKQELMKKGWTDGQISEALKK